MRTLSLGRKSLWSPLTLVGFGALLASTIVQADDAVVRVSPVIERTVNSGEIFVGSVLPSKTSVVGAPVEGNVIEVGVELGDTVEKGQVLARLNADLLTIELEAQKAELVALKQDLAELEAGSRPEEIAAAEARMLGAKANWDLNVERLKRVEILFSRSNSSAEERDTALYTTRQAEQAYYEGKAAYELAKAGPRPESVVRARARVQVQQEMIRRLQSDIEKHTITAPFDGFVVARDFEVGQWIAQGAPVATVAAMETLEVEVNVLEEYYAQLQKGSPADVRLGNSNVALKGTVTKIVPSSNVRSRTFPVRVEVVNPMQGGQMLLHAGMFAKVRLAVGRGENMILVPKDSLVFGQGTPSVYVVDSKTAQPDQGTVHRVAVAIGDAEGHMVRITNDHIRPGQSVVVQGNERLRPEQSVRILSSQSLDGEKAPPANPRRHGD